MRNSSLVEQFCAEDVTGLSLLPKLWIWIDRNTQVVGERSLFVEGKLESFVEDREERMPV